MVMELVVLGYLDAGTGSLIFQVLVASLVSAGVVFGGAMTQLRGFISRVVFRRKPEPSSSESTQSPDAPVIAFHRETAQEPDQQRKAA